MTGMDAVTGRPLTGIDHLRQSIAKIIGTPLGSRVGRRDFGSAVPELIGRPLNPATRLAIVAAGAIALLRQEPRIRATRIRVEPGDRAGAVVLRIEGTLTDLRWPTPVALTIPVTA